MGAQRSKRTCVLRKKLVPSAVHYVGYVEDDETPEMIMKKFEELERIVSKGKEPEEGQPEVGPDEQAQAERQGSLDNDQLLEVFKATSIFNVKSALANNDVLRAGGEHACEQDRWSDGGGATDGEDEYLSELRGFWSDEDWKAANKASTSAAAARPAAERRARPPGWMPRSQRTAVVTQYNRESHALIRRRVRVVDRDAVTHVRIPRPPLPSSWGRTVAPYQPPAAGAAGDAAPDGKAAQAAGASMAAGCSVEAPGEHLPLRRSSWEAADVTTFDFACLPQRHYLAVMINTGWLLQPSGSGGDAASGADEAGTQSGQHSPGPNPGWLPSAKALERLKRLPLPSLCPRGFVFIWTHKEHLSAVMRQACSWGFAYVENLTWVLMAPNNSVLRLPHSFTNKSHISLLIFRREGEGRDIELRHQRNADVVLDCVRYAEGCEWQVPPAVYTTIETLLPTGKGSFLEIWGAEGVMREGWTHVIQRPP